MTAPAPAVSSSSASSSPTPADYQRLERAITRFVKETTKHLFFLVEDAVIFMDEETFNIEFNFTGIEEVQSPNSKETDLVSKRRFMVFTDDDVRYKNMTPDHLIAGIDHKTFKPLPASRVSIESVIFTQANILLNEFAQFWYKYDLPMGRISFTMFEDGSYKFREATVSPRGNYVYEFDTIGLPATIREYADMITFSDKDRVRI